jgi:hypothetical protein
MKVIAILLAVFMSGTNVDINSDAQKDIMGSWTLVKYRYGQEESLNDVPEFLTYIKNVTDSHFSWCSFNPEDGNITGSGGGTYRLEKDLYIETADFWFPSGTDIPGTETPFNYTVKGNSWTISGYIRQVEINPASGEMQYIDSVYLEEVWQRVTY